MKNYTRKLAIMFIMTFTITLGCFTSAFAADKNGSIKINNTTLNFNKTIYVDNAHGDDLNGDGSELNPFKSLSKAAGVVDTDNTLIYMLTPGTYEVPNGLQSLLSSNYALTYTTSSSNFGKIVIDLQNTSTNLSIKMEKLNRFIGLNFIRSTGGDNRTYEYFYDYARINIDFNNCAFMSSPAITDSWAPIFSGNSSGCEITELKFTNCSFLKDFRFIGENGNSPYISIKGAYTNCAFKDTSGMSYKSNIANVAFDDIYNITSEGWKNTGIGTNPDGTQSNIGVYGGEFAWGDSQLDEKNISLDQSSLTLKERNSKKLTAITTPSSIDIEWLSSDDTIATVDKNGNVTAVKEGQATITAQIKSSKTKATCIVTVTGINDGNTNPTNPTDNTDGTSNIVNIAHAKGDNTNNAGGEVSIIFKGVAEAQLSVLKTADVKSVYVGDTFTYTIVVTNASLQTAKAVIMNDSAPNHIDFIVNGVTTTQGKVDSSSTSKNIVVNVGDIPPSGKVTIKIPANVVL